MDTTDRKRKKISNTSSEDEYLSSDSDDEHSVNDEQATYKELFKNKPNDPRFVFNNARRMETNYSVSPPKFTGPNLASSQPTLFADLQSAPIPQQGQSNQIPQASQPTQTETIVIDDDEEIAETIPIEQPVMEQPMEAQPTPQLNIEDFYNFDSNKKVLLNKNCTKEELVRTFNMLVAILFTNEESSPVTYQQSVQENNVRNLEAQALREQLKHKNELLANQLSIFEEKKKEYNLAQRHLRSHQRFIATEYDLRQFRRDYINAKKVMELQRDPTETELNAAYRTALRRCHPDTNKTMTTKEAEEATKDLTAARDLIKSVLVHGLEEHTKMQIDPTYYAFKKNVAALHSECTILDKGINELRQDISDIKSEIKKNAI
jgi:regulator of replication initiation timing